MLPIVHISSGHSRRSACSILAVMAVCFSVVLGATDAQATESTKNFVKDASVGNEFEIQSSQLALEKTQNPGLKKFAQHMIDDHSKAEEDLKTAVSGATDADIQMPDDSLDHKHKNMLKKLNSEQGKDFDTLYVKDQVSAHDDAVSLFKNYANDGDNQVLKGFAGETLPTLQAHQQDIHKIKSSM